ncbi:sensor histidine kinase [Persicitalea jodogahamensis]|uniref:sensor histidine kinase n=1 Tax=Persicitalea jodogahamensis TaxID=402147 RepID=UPI0016744E8B|nr:ATP-binding protein [Persicitalea jodogahamensis]
MENLRQHPTYMNISPERHFLKRSLSEEQLSWAIRFLFGISVFLIVILSISYHSINQELIFYSEKVDHTHEVLDNVQDIRTRLYQVTYYGRGYLVMIDSVNRRNMLERLASVPHRIDYLSELTQDSPTQHAKVDSLRHYFALYEKSVVNFGMSDPAKLDLSSKLTLLRNGTSKTENLNEILDRIASVENKLMQERIISRDNYKQQIFRFNWVIMGVALAFLLCSFLLLERELKRTKGYRIELENQVENLNRSNAELEQFAYVASHDLQEPLRKIRSFADLLKTKNKDNLTEESKQIVGKIIKSASRMQLLIDDLLAFSRSIDSPREIEQVDLNDILRDVRANIKGKMQEHNADIRSDTLPTVTGYGNQLTQLFENILSNSLKYCKPGLCPEIVITSSEISGSSIAGIRESQLEDIFHQIVIKDNGIGFRNEYAEKIFVIFQRLHGQDDYQGSGIGLAICRKVVANHNGYIMADGEEGKGARFYIYLPQNSSTV